MSANINDHFNKASNMNGGYPPVATVSSARVTGGSTLSCDSLSGWATDTPVHFSTFKISADGTIDTTTQTDWKGIVVGNTITEMTRLAGAADSGNASGDKVELNPTIGWLNDLITGILASHKQSGALKDSVVTESTIATNAVSVNKIASGAVTEAKLASGAVTNAKIGSAAVKSANIDWSTMPSYSTSEVNTKRTWINGKTIYKKTVNFGALPNNTIKSVNHNISNLSQIVKTEGIAISSTGSMSLPQASPVNTNYSTSLTLNSTQITIRTGTSDFTSYNAYVTLYYTKTS